MKKKIAGRTRITSPLKASHLRMLQRAKQGPVFCPIDGGTALSEDLPMRGAVAYGVIHSLIRRQLLTDRGEINEAGRGVLAKNAELASECA